METIENLLLDDCSDEAIPLETNNRDWCKPLQASMSRLVQMQPSMCNILLQDATSLKPPKSLSKHRKQRETVRQNSTGTDHLGGIREENDVINSNRSLSKTSAWGSKSSITDLLARQKSRPNSATRVPPRNRPDSARRGGLSSRPQSAHESTQGKKEEVPKDFGIQGSKKPVDARAPPVPRCNSETGFSSRSEASNPHTWAYPAGRETPTIHTIDTENKTEPANPERSQAEETQDEIPDHGLRPSQDEEKPVTPPVPESIRFSLPNMNDDNSDNDTDDELNTERLLRQADDIVQAKSRENGRLLQSLTDANATVPEDVGESLIPNVTLETENYEHLDASDPTCAIFSVAAHNRDSHLTNGGDVLSPHVTWSESHKVRLFKPDSPSVVDADLEDMSDSGSRRLATGRRPGPHSSRGGLGRGTDSRDATEVETFKNHRKQPDGDNHFIMLNGESEIEFKQLELSQSGLGGSGLGKVRPGSGKQGAARNNTGGGMTENCPVEKSEHQFKSCISSDDHKDFVSHSEEPLKKLVPTVTLAFCEEEEEQKDIAEATQKNGTKKKIRRRRTFDDIETYMSQMDKREQVVINNNNCNNSLTNIMEGCQCGDISCNELLSQTSNQQTASNINQTRPYSASKSRFGAFMSSDSGSVVKTTKTIQFCENGAPGEDVSKNELVIQQDVKPEKSKHVGGTEMLIKPSEIKRQLTTETKMKPRPTSAVRRNDSATQSSLSSQKVNTKTPNKLNSGEDTHKDVGGGLAPPSTNQPETKGDKSGDRAFVTLLEEAKAMALTSMMEAARRPTSGKKKTASKTKSQESGSDIVEPSDTTVSVCKPKARPFSAPLKISSSTQKAATSLTTSIKSTATNSNYEYKHKYCQDHTHQGHSSTGIRRAQSARPGRLTNNLTSVIDQEDNSAEMYQVQRMQMKMASMGVDVDARSLERALYPPSGKSTYYNIPGDLPRNPTDTLIPHYKHWLAEDYRKVKLLERKLARDDHIKYLLKVAEEKKAALKKANGKKKGKGKKKGRPKCSTPAS